jgi:hypothetical protein
MIGREGSDSTVPSLISNHFSAKWMVCFVFTR